MDRSTVFSIFPKDIEINNPFVQPGNFKIEKGSIDKPSSLIIGTSSYWQEIHPEQPLVEIPVSSVVMAKSLVDDYCGGILGFAMDERAPGFFFMIGEISVVQLKTQHKAVLERAAARQKAWYMELINLADALWARSNGNPMIVSDDMKIAARELGMDHKDWLKNYKSFDLIRCKACGTMNQSSVVVCPNCKIIIDEARFKELGLKFAVN